MVNTGAKQVHKNLQLPFLPCIVELEPLRAVTDHASDAIVLRAEANEPSSQQILIAAWPHHCQGGEQDFLEHLI